MLDHSACLHETAIEKLVNTSTQPLLLTFGASWCVHCNNLQPALQSLAADHPQAFKLIRFDIEDAPWTRSRFNIHNIPTTLLIQQGKEVDRMLGVRSVQQLSDWLKRAGVFLETAATHTASEQWQAFHKDPGLRDFLLGRLLWHARAGHLQGARFASWQNGKGTLSAALVHSAEYPVFERVTGMPYGIACLLELLGLDKTLDIDTIIRAIPLGADLSTVPLRFMELWLADEENNWPDFLENDELDTLRRQWLQLTRQGQQGGVTRQDWQQLQARLEPFNNPAPLATRQKHLASLLKALAPAPPAQAAAEWQHCISLLGVYTLIALVRRQQGWQAKDFAKEVELIQWFSQRQAREPGGVFTETTLHQAQDEWLALPKDMDYLAKEEAFHARQDELLRPCLQRCQQHLLQLFSEAAD